MASSAASFAALSRAASRRAAALAATQTSVTEGVLTAMPGRVRAGPGSGQGEVVAVDRLGVARGSTSRTCTDCMPATWRSSSAE